MYVSRLTEDIISLNLMQTSPPSRGFPPPACMPACTFYQQITLCVQLLPRHRVRNLFWVFCAPSHRQELHRSAWSFVYRTPTMMSNVISQSRAHQDTIIYIYIYIYIYMCVCVCVWASPCGSFAQLRLHFFEVKAWLIGVLRHVNTR